MKQLSLLLFSLLFFSISEAALNTARNSIRKTQKCKSPLSANGVFSKTYFGTTDPFVTGTGARSHTYTISFGVTFCKVPKVHLGITGFDLSSTHNQRFIASVSSITKTGFVVKFDTWADTIIYMARIEWLAIKTPN